VIYYTNATLKVLHYTDNFLFTYQIDLVLNVKQHVHKMSVAEMRC